MVGEFHDEVGEFHDGVIDAVHGSYLVEVPHMVEVHYKAVQLGPPIP